MELKRHWLGQHWYLPGAAGNDINKTNVPNIRLTYRHQTLIEELSMLKTSEVGTSPSQTSAKTLATALDVNLRYKDAMNKL